MQKALHGISTHYCNIITDARIARDTGYDSLELLSAKLVRYLDNGGTTQKLKQLADGYGLSVGCVNALLEMERHKGDERKTMLAEATRLTRAAAELECPTVQILALYGLEDKPEAEMMDILTENVSDIASIGEEYGVRYQIEVIAFTQFRTLAQGLELIKRVGKKNVGMVIDFWHLYAAGTLPEEVARMDKELIYGVHFCDGRLPKPGEAWDQMVLRNYMPGEGEIDIPAWVKAVKDAGYDGMWSAELFSPNRWEHDLYEIATQCRENMEKYIGK